MGCIGIKVINSYNSSPPNTGAYCFYNLSSSTALYVPLGKVNAYQNANGWWIFAPNINETTITDLSIEINKTINIYPNPISDYLQFYDNKEKGKLTITDLNGKLLMNKQIMSNENVSVKLLPKGLYVVKLITNRGTIERKIIKE